MKTLVGNGGEPECGPVSGNPVSGGTQKGAAPRAVPLTHWLAENNEDLVALFSLSCIFFKQKEYNFYLAS